MTPEILVIGSTGTIGRHVLPELLTRGAAVRALVRSESSAARLPVAVEPYIGDLGDPDTVRKALDGVQAALYVSPHETTEVELAETFVAACEENGARLIFAGFHVPDPTTRAEIEQHLPFYRGKLRVGVTIAESATRPVVLDLSDFAQNDEVFREDILNGDYPVTIVSAGVNRIDLRDAGEVAANALTDPAFPGGLCGLRGPESLSGEECAAIWSAELGRPVRYVGHDDEVREEIFRRRLSGQKLNDWLNTFSARKIMPVPTDPALVENTTRMLGRPPRNYRTYVHDAALRWRNEVR